MVLSVVAFAAPASAAVTNADRTVPSDDVSTNTTVDIPVTIDTDSGGFSGTIEDAFSGPVDDASVSVDSAAGGSVITQVADDTGSTVGIQNANGQIQLTYTLETGPSNGTITIDDGSGSAVDFGAPQTIGVDSSVSTSSGPVVLNRGLAPAGQSFANYGALDGSIAWQGQDITVESGLSSGDIQLRERIDTENTRLAAEYSVSGGDLTFSTDDRTPGDYFLSPQTPSLDRNSNGIPSQEETFEIAEQSLSASFGADSVTLSGPNSDDEAFEFDSNRFAYPMNVTTASGDLNAENLYNIFVAGDSSFELITSDVNGDDETVTLGYSGSSSGDVTDSDEYEVDFEEADIDAGDYEFVFSPSDSTAEDTDTITVTESNQDANFAEGVEQQAAGDIATFNVSLEDTNDAFVQIGSGESNFVEVLYLDEDTDDSMEVQINTRLLGSNAPLGAVYSTDNVDTLLSATHENSNGDTIEDVISSSGDLGGIEPAGSGDITLYEDDEQSLTNDIDTYVDDIGIASDADNMLTRPPQPTDYQIAVGGTNNVDEAVFDADLGGEANNQLGSMTLELTEPQINDVTVHTAPEETADDEGEVAELVEDATPREEIAIEDRMVVQFEATGIFGGIVANGSANPQQTDFDRINDGVPTDVLNNYITNTSDEVTVEVVANEDIGNQEPLEVDLSAGSADTYLATDQANDQFFLIADTSSDGAFANGDAPEGEKDFTATIEYDADEGDAQYEFPNTGSRTDQSPPFATTDDNFPYLQQGDVISESAELSLAPRSISLDNLNDEGVLEVPASESAEITATTNVAPGSDAELRVTSTDASTSFRQGNEVNVTEDGSIASTFDLGDQATGDEFDTNFRVEGSQVDTVDSIIASAGAGEETNETDTGNETDMDDGEEEPVDDGEEEPADDGTTNETDDGETDDGTPGFGAVVALVALVGAALLAVRRQD